MNYYRKYFLKQLDEDSSYSSGTMGPAATVDHSGIANTDWYAPGDARIPMGGRVYKRNGVVKKMKTTKKRKK